MENNINDEIISSVVRSVENKIPGSVEKRLIYDMGKVNQKKRFFWKKYLFWYPASAIATIILGIILLRPFQTDQSIIQSPVTEIRTEFEIKDKNIKIIWFQKKDFEPGRLYK